MVCGSCLPTYWDKNHTERIMRAQTPVLIWKNIFPGCFIYSKHLCYTMYLMNTGNTFHIMKPLCFSWEASIRKEDCSVHGNAEIQFGWKSENIGVYIVDILIPPIHLCGMKGEWFSIRRWNRVWAERLIPEIDKPSQMSYIRNAYINMRLLSPQYRQGRQDSTCPTPKL